MCEKCREMDEKTRKSDRYAARAGDAARSVTGGSIPQHVSMDRERQPSGHAKPFNQLLGTFDGKWCLALRQEHKVGVWMFASKCPQ